MKIFTSGTVWNQANTRYPFLNDISTEEGFKAAMLSDHVCAEYKNNIRSVNNFITSDCLPMDCDNDHSDDPADWITPADVAEDFPGATFYYCASRSHNRIKHEGRPDEKSARPRYHYYFPINEVKSAAEYSSMKQKLYFLASYFDDNALDAGRFFYATKEIEDCGMIAGDHYIDKVLSTVELPPAPAEIPEPQPVSKPIRPRASEYKTDYLECLSYIPVSSVSYQDWICIGTALKTEGYDCYVWDDWSRNDSRYKVGVCAKKWRTFKTNRVNGGFIVNKAKEYGWMPATKYTNTKQPSTTKATKPISAAASAVAADPAPIRAASMEETYYDIAEAQYIEPPQQPSVFDDTPKPDNVCAYLSGAFAADLENFQKFKGRNTGFRNIDQEINGLYPGLYVLGAISSLGKTTFSHQMADQLAATEDHVLYFSLEQTRLEMVSKGLSRLTAQQTLDNGFIDAISAIEIRRGRSNDVLKDAMNLYSMVTENMSIIQCGFDTTVEYIIDYVRKYIEVNNVKPVVFIDYLQILRPIDPRKTTKDAVDETVRALKKLQADNDLVVIVISSLNRQNYLTPIDFESFKESGGIEYTADVIWGLQLACLEEELFEKKDKLKEKRERVKEAKLDDPRKISFVCLKNRYGKSSYSCEFKYYPQYDLFVDASEFVPYDEI